MSADDEATVGPGVVAGITDRSNRGHDVHWSPGWLRRGSSWRQSAEAARRISPRRASAALGDLEQSAHDPYRKGGLVRLFESEERFGVAVLSLANQAAVTEGGAAGEGDQASV